MLNKDDKENAESFKKITESLRESLGRTRDILRLGPEYKPTPTISIRDRVANKISRLSLICHFHDILQSHAYMASDTVENLNNYRMGECEGERNVIYKDLERRLENEENKTYEKLDDLVQELQDDDFTHSGIEDRIFMLTESVEILKSREGSADYIEEAEKILAFWNDLIQNNKMINELCELWY